MAEKALLIEMRPKIQEMRDARTYSELQVKQVLYAFARDLGCRWRKKRLEDFIETAFNF
jgi:hypothetical protein